jgi:hypothetical protein
VRSGLRYYSNQDLRARLVAVEAWLALQLGGPGGALPL